jgi:two-component system response regulator HydG/two-component system response regulator AtoC
LISGTIRLVHWDEKVRSRWRSALGHLGAEVIESGSLAGTDHSGTEIVIAGDTGSGTRATLALLRKYPRPHCAVIMVVSRGDSCEEFAIDALRLGVRAYLREPATPEMLAGAVEKCLEHVAAPVEPRPTCGLIGQSDAMKRVRCQIKLAASVDSTVLITGESGTGKEVTARALHALSGRAGRLVPLNCAAIPDTLLESELFGYERGAFTGAHHAEAGKLAQANAGTLFLDEIGELSPPGQAKLLRAIELKEVHPLGSRKSVKVDVRVVAATNRNLEDLVADGRFREDLYYRLNVVVIHMAPLRELSGDLPLLVDHFLAELNARFHQDVRGVDTTVQTGLSRYRWPGNVRELRNMLEATCVGMPGPTIHFEHLPELYQRRFTETSEAPGAFSERHRLLEVLNATHWNKSKAAQQLRWSRVTLYRKLARYGISDPQEGI